MSLPDFPSLKKKKRPKPHIHLLSSFYESQHVLRGSSARSGRARFPPRKPPKLRRKENQVMAPRPSAAAQPAAAHGLLLAAGVVRLRATGRLSRAAYLGQERNRELSE